MATTSPFANTTLCLQHNRRHPVGEHCPDCLAVKTVMHGDPPEPGAVWDDEHGPWIRMPPGSAMNQAPKTDKPTAKKMDDGKVPVWQGFMRYFPRAIFAVALVSEYGKRKYAPDAPEFNSGWREVANGLNRYMDADARHFLKHGMGLLYDDESEMAHLAHKAWNAMAELERAINDGVVELRRGVEIVDGKPVPGTHKVLEMK